MSGHEPELLGAYVLGVLDGDEWASVRGHLDGCPQCRREVDDLREMEAALGEIPPEAFLEGPPPGGELLLRRTLDQVREEHRHRTRRRYALLTAAAAGCVVAALGAGLVVGRVTGPETAAAPPAPNAASPLPSSPLPSSLPAATRTGSVTDARTGASMTVAVRPAAGWVRVRATVSGVAAGEQCRLYVVARDGSRWQAGSWLSGGPAAAAGVTVDGSALIAPAEVASVQAETYAGLVLVSTPV